jgi:regulator of RNase E activity RraA
MNRISDIVRPPKDLIERLKDIGDATVAGTLGHMGFKNPHMVGPVAQDAGRSIVGPALTLQFMPQRPDLFSEGENADPETQLHRHVLHHVQGDRLFKRPFPSPRHPEYDGTQRPARLNLSLDAG